MEDTSASGRPIDRWDTQCIHSDSSKSVSREDGKDGKHRPETVATVNKLMGHTSRRQFAPQVDSRTTSASVLANDVCGCLANSRHNSLSGTFEATTSYGMGARPAIVQGATQQSTHKIDTYRPGKWQCGAKRHSLFYTGAAAYTGREPYHWGY